MSKKKIHNPIDYRGSDDDYSVLTDFLMRGIPKVKINDLDTQTELAEVMLAGSPTPTPQEVAKIKCEEERKKSQQDFNRATNDLMSSKLPVWVSCAISEIAWEQGHAQGYGAVAYYIRNFQEVFGRHFEDIPGRTNGK